MYQQKFNEKLKQGFFNTCKLFNYDNNKFVLILRKGVYSYEYMDDWEKFNETKLPEREDFYSHLNVEEITDADYAHAKKFVKILKQKPLENLMICIFKVIHYCSRMYLTTLEICVLIYMNLILQNFFQLQD